MQTRVLFLGWPNSRRVTIPIFTAPVGCTDTGASTLYDGLFGNSEGSYTAEVNSLLSEILSCCEVAFCARGSDAAFGCQKLCEYLSIIELDHCLRGTVAQAEKVVPSTHVICRSHSNALVEGAATSYVGSECLSFLQVSAKLLRMGSHFLRLLSAVGSHLGKEGTLTVDFGHPPERAVKLNVVMKQYAMMAHSLQGANRRTRNRRKPSSFKKGTKVKKKNLKRNKQNTFSADVDAFFKTVYVVDGKLHHYCKLDFACCEGGQWGL